MWSIKHNLTVLAVLVGAVVSAWGSEPTYSVDVYPLTFGSSYDTTTQLNMWNRLMKYKLFATGTEGGYGITIMGNVSITDSVGYIGSAKGGLSESNQTHSLGGPMLFGGSFKSGDGGDSFLTGPTRFKGYFNVSGNGAGSNSFYGNYCLESGYSGYTTTGVNSAGGRILTEAECESTDLVYAVDEDLDVPWLDTTVSYNSGINTNGGTVYIHVPPAAEGDSSAYNYFIQSIKFTNGGKLHVVMPPEGRLTKIYVQGSISGFGDAGNPEIAVVYATGGSWNGSRWINFSDVALDNADYAGNLLFYTPNAIKMGAAQKTMQGTYISGGQISFQQHTHFAGQLLAKTIYINANFDAKDFRYVPFNPPLVSLNMAVDQQLSEDRISNYEGDTLAIELTKTPTTDVTFWYCFVFDGTEPTGTARATTSDVSLDTIPLPICEDKFGKKDSAFATIKKGSKKPETPIKIWIIDDQDVEMTESFQLKIWNLAGGTFSDNSREWPVRFFISDNDNEDKDPIVPKCPSSIVFTGDEDEIFALGSGEGFFTLVDSASGNIIEDYRLTIRSVSKGNLNYGIGSSLSSNDLYYGGLKFQGAQNEYGNTYATIGFDVSVGSQSATGCSMVINLNAVNDPPNATGFDTTITENNAKGIKIGQVKAEDVEGSKLYYKITYGNANDVFRIDASGNFYVDSVLDYEYFAEGHNIYPMVVLVCDAKIQSDGTSSGLCTSVSVNVTVANENEPPKIKVLNGTIDENAIKGTDVHSSGDSAQVFASDPEDAYNKLKYEIVSGNTNNAFILDTAGYFVVNGTIDYETTPSYSIKVKVSDTQGLWDTATVVITVNDINEPPSATGFTVSVDENVVPTDPIGKVNVEDQDHNEVFTYCFWLGEGNCVTSVEDGLFSINASGEVSMLEAADYEDEKANEYHFIVEVTDKGGNKAPADVYININNVNEKPVAHDTTGSVNEGASLGLAIAYVRAEDAENNRVDMTFSIIEKDARNLFAISNNKDSVGVITVAGTIDYETITTNDATKSVCKSESGAKKCTFRVEVKDKGVNGSNILSDTATVVITINNVNEIPVATGFSADIDENVTTKTKLGQIVASDVDEGDVLTYAFYKGNDANGMFELDGSGNVYAVKPADYESESSYHLIVTVTDKDGVEVPAYVDVSINNVNEKPTAYDTTGTVAENVRMGLPIAIVRAADAAGEDPLTALTFSIIEKDARNLFAISNNKDSMGVITVAGTIDYETITTNDATKSVCKSESGAKKCTFRVEVKDKGVNGSNILSDTATVVITINNVNEIPVATGFSADIDENVTTKTKLGQIVASDVDEGDVLTYAFYKGNDANGMFELDGSGNVYAVKPADYESESSYHLIVTVTDKDGVEVPAYVDVSINNVNEKPTAYDTTGTVAENVRMGLPIAIVRAADAAGEDPLTALTFSIIEKAARNLFAISNNKDSMGVITVAGAIDYETITTNDATKSVCKLESGAKKCTFRVEVKDKGVNGANVLSDTATVVITVNNVNESPVATGFSADIDENVTTKTKLGQIVASDVDEGDVLTYTFYEGYDANGMFELDGSGNVYAVKPANYEEVKEYHLIVVVKDKDGLEAPADVYVSINNVNEAPSAKNVVASVKENAAVGKIVEFVYAEDPDDAVTALKYEIVEAEAQKYFTIVNSSNPDSVGAIKVNGSIDYESLGAEKTIQFTIRVTDKGGLSATATATITIEDVNEAPIAKGFHVTLDENDVPTDPLGKVDVADVDAGDVMSYSFFSGNVDDMFAVDQNGNIIVVKAADYEDINSFELTVLVKDSGNLTDTAIVLVSIKDVNEAPTTSDKVFEIKENMPSGTVVGTVPVKDVDKKEEFRKNQFAFADGDTAFFKINATTGEITTKKAFDYEEKATYKLKVRVYDPDDNEAFSNVTVNIKDVKETSVLVITRAETESGDKSWDYPKEVLYVNEKSMILQWTADDVQMPDTLVENLHEGLNTITIAYTDPKKDEGTSVQLVVFVSTTTPQVVISTVTEEQEEGNIFTIKEERAENDTTAYVNQKDAQISITVKEPILDATYTDSTCKWNTKTTSVKTDLDIIDVPASTFTAMNSVVEEGVYLNENPSTPATHTPYNGDQVKVTYTEKVAGKEVQVSYVTDEKGNPVKETVVDLNGNVETIEVITVSYETKVGNQTVTISYTADAATGQPVLAKGTAAYNEVIAAQTSGGKNGSQSGNTSGSGANVGTGDKGNTSSGTGTSAGTGDKGNTSGSGTSAGTGDKSNPSGSGTSTGTGDKGNTSGNGTNSGNVPSNVIDLSAIFTVSYDYTTKAKNGTETTVQVSYVVDKSGKVVKDVDGNIGYTVSFTYENEMGNASTESVFVIVDVIPPKVKILSPAPDTVLYSNYVDVKWTVDYGDGRGPIVQDTLNNQGLEKGVNAIVRFYMDKAGNIASDTVFVVMKNAKDVDIRVETPITTVTTKDVEEHYAKNEPEKGQTFSVSVYSPKLGKEVETQVGGEFKTKEGSGDEPYPGVEGHLGPTLSIETKLPVISAVTGLATLDDLIGKDGLVNLDGVDAANSEKVSLDDYVLGFTNAKGEQVEYCTEEFREDYRAANGDLSRLNMYTTTMSMKIWVYTSLGQFVDYFTFTQEMDDPDLVSDAGVLKLYFEQKPDKNGDLRTKEGRVYATGAYIYKTEVSLKTTLRCSLPPVNDASNAANRKNAKRKVTENMLKTFGYKRPSEDK
ncbi:MAG: cadherin domain-containing protein [Fibrobacter sp.]|nr:cadherin domain-containing protein [Fibrobacter sp.]